MAKRRTDSFFRNEKAADKPRKVADSNGLYLLIQKNGSRFWRYRYSINGRESVVALGDYSEMSLQAAREARDAARRLVKQGINPAQHRKAARIIASDQAANTFEAVAREWIEQHRKDWTPYYFKQVSTVLEQDVFSKIGGLPIREVKSAHLLAILKEVRDRPAPTIAILIRQWCSAVFLYAIATLRADNDIAAAVKGAVKKPKTRHKTPLSPAEIPLLMERVEAARGTVQVQTALHLLLLTFVRPGELRQAQWSEFDLDRALWAIPEARMKMREAHVVPLSTQAVALLRKLRAVSGSNPLLFPNVRDPHRAMSPTTLNRSLERMGYAKVFSAHGFRTTASTLLNEMGFHPDWIEKQLAHDERNASRRHYNRAKYVQERTKMMQAWADYLDGLRSGDVVIPIHAGRRPA
ncbi:tyrosine-type recombinase/integrase [Lysobacter sp. S4-A87]|uniref:tyrosine-type recombinase/integrase n=1 Tax=Lysobacter sp. S4-A87 TaxID=2925843 RepID=UPI001F539FC1|nr:integrase arm-type DNA-binding domain-containing protein [Lysobacter sp. S4-A87]UNK48848.1 tyrosine-type recombinase/integrase [Lysobacter sp. S4-A87]